MKKEYTRKQNIGALKVFCFEKIVNARKKRLNHAAEISYGAGVFWMIISKKVLFISLINEMV